MHVQPAQRPWFEDWFDRDYLEVYAHRDDADARRGIALLSRATELDPTAPLLDLGCGPARHLSHLLPRQGRSVGLDLSPVLLDEARRRLGDGAELVRGDMRRLPFAAGSFQVVASLFTSFGYFEATDDDRHTLIEIHRVLTPGGRLFLDFVNRQVVLAQLPPDNRRLLGRRELVERRRFDPAVQRLVKEIEIHGPDGVRRIRESVRLYSPAEVQELCREAGLEPAERFGDLDGAAFVESRSPRLMLVARRR